MTADEVYGGSPALRGWLEDRGVWHVLAVKCTEPLDVCSPNGMRTSAEQRASAVPAEQWVACSAGYGAKGRRLDDWTRLQLASPAATPLVGLVRVAGTRWAVEEGFEQAKGEVGLDHYDQQALDAIAARLNGRPRAVLGWHTPAEVLAAYRPV